MESVRTEFPSLDTRETSVTARTFPQTLTIFPFLQRVPERA